MMWRDEVGILEMLFSYMSQYEKSRNWSDYRSVLLNILAFHETYSRNLKEPPVSDTQSVSTKPDRRYSLQFPVLDGTGGTNSLLVADPSRHSSIARERLYSEYSDEIFEQKRISADADRLDVVVDPGLSLHSPEVREIKEEEEEEVVLLEEKKEPEEDEKISGRSEMLMDGDGPPAAEFQMCDFSDEDKVIDNAPRIAVGPGLGLLRGADWAGGGGSVATDEDELPSPSRRSLPAPQATGSGALAWTVPLAVATEAEERVEPPGAALALPSGMRRCGPQPAGSARRPAFSLDVSALSLPLLPAASPPADPERKKNHIERPFSCAFCLKNFSSRERMERHQIAHSKERPFVCSYCPKSFLSTSDKTKHERIHRNEKPYACRYCGKAFSDCSNRYKHERTHTRQQLQQQLQAS